MNNISHTVAALLANRMIDMIGIAVIIVIQALAARADWRAYPGDLAARRANPGKRSAYFARRYSTWVGLAFVLVFFAVVELGQYLGLL